MKDKQGRRVLPNLTNPPPEPEPSSEWVDKLLANTTPESVQRMQMISEAFAREERQLEAIKANRPLGSVVPREPKSLHYSEVPGPAWKRKLRP